MENTKIAFIWLAMAVFLGFSIIGALGAFNVISVSNWSTVAAIAGPCIGICASAFGAKHLFHDPEATTKLKDKHADAIREINNQHADAIAEIRSEHAVAVARHEKETADMKALLLEQNEEQVNIIAKKDSQIAHERDARNKAEKELESRPPKSFLECILPPDAT